MKGIILYGFAEGVFMEECQDRRPVVFISGAGVKKEIPDELEKFCHVVQWTGKEPISSQDMKNGIRNADILVLAFHSRLDREEVQEAARLKLVIQNFAGYERVDVQACTEFGIPFCNAASPSGSTVAEMALTLILASRRQLLSYVDAMRAGQWVHSPNNTWDEGHNLAGYTAGILGMGHIGSVLASFLQCLGMHVIYHNRHPLPAGREQGCRWVSSKRLYQESDVLINVLPASSSTKGIIDIWVFRQMKKNALFVNVGRGDTVVTEDLVTALREGHIAQAALDVCDPEPLPAVHPLRSMKQVLLTPHIASSTEETRAAKEIQLIQNVKNVLTGEKLIDCVNQEAIQEFHFKKLKKI
jgi:glyoxylate reductase